MLSIVIDTNVFISALLKSKNCIEILEALKLNKFKFLISRELFEELLIVIGNPKFEFSTEEKKEFKNLIIEKALLIKPEKNVSVCRDPKDNIVLECALAGKADFIITGDKDLLSIKSFKKNFIIITPQQFIHKNLS